MLLMRCLWLRSQCCKWYDGSQGHWHIQKVYLNVVIVETTVCKVCDNIFWNQRKVKKQVNSEHDGYFYNNICNIVVGIKHFYKTMMSLTRVLLPKPFTMMLLPVQLRESYFIIFFLKIVTSQPSQKPMLGDTKLVNNYFHSFYSCHNFSGLSIQIATWGDLSPN